MTTLARCPFDRWSVFIGLALCGWMPGIRPPRVVAQPTTIAIPRERVHPEMTDATWGRRTAVAWQLAFAHQFADARAAFESLHREQPQAIEPMLGLGLVARSVGHAADARRWYRDALAVDPASADAREGLRAADWDRPLRIDLGVGSARVSGATTSDWNLGATTPITPQLSVNASVGQITGGDPFHGIFFDSARGGGARSTFVSAGAVLRPTSLWTLVIRGTRIAADSARTFVWLEAGTRVGPRAGAHIGLRPASGSGSLQVYGGLDARIIGTQVATIELVQGTRAAPFESRSAVRLFYDVTPSIRGSYRLLLIREIDPRLSATTVGATATWYVQPRVGLTAGASVRRGAFARSSASVGIVLRR